MGSLWHQLVKEVGLYQRPLGKSILQNDLKEATLSVTESSQCSASSLYLHFAVSRQFFSEEDPVRLTMSSVFHFEDSSYVFFLVLPNCTTMQIELNYRHKQDLS